MSSTDVRCATLHCGNRATVRMAYKVRPFEEVDTEDVCQECAESYGRRVVIRIASLIPLTEVEN